METFKAKAPRVKLSPKGHSFLTLERSGPYTAVAEKELCLKDRLEKS